MQGRPKHIRRWVAAILIYMTPERVSGMLKHDMGCGPCVAELRVVFLNMCHSCSTVEFLPSF
jgi:hypothetical protein